MNAACALQHFCDIHGPQILLCTEGRTYTHDLNDTDNDGLKAFYAQYIKTEHSQEKLECKSCTLSSDVVLVSTTDSINQMLYISASSTPNQELFKNIRNACVRSLTIEKSTENGHPVLFGDDASGYCLSLTFSCKDFHARGSQRLYSLCYLCTDRYHMISLMRFISDCMRQAVDWLQHDADTTYEQEARIKVNTKLNATTETYIIRPPPRLPLQRMLIDVVHDSKIAYRIHALFVWILRTGHSVISESLFDALPTEEQTTKQERHDACGNEYIRKDRSTTVIETSPVILANNIPDYFTTKLYSTIDSYNTNDNDFSDRDDDDDYDSLEYQFSSYGCKALQLFRDFSQKLKSLKHLQYILYNWIIGNQLIIKYTNSTDNKEIIRAIASVFRLFLPDGCCRLMETTNSIPSYEVNLILFDTDLILTESDEIEANNDNSSIIIKIIIDNIDDSIQEAKLETLPVLKSDIIVPTYVKTIVELLADNSLDDEAFDAIITQHKIKYLNKSKLYFQMGRCRIASTSSISEDQQMNILHIRNPSDLMMIRFWQKGLSNSYQAQIRILIQDDNQQQHKTQENNNKINHT
ncbi:unnamed protein product [Rotaria socialis]|uniref:Folliculin n=2 Tax=Rotaria socialis TaxID=392032 RepID=A0A817QFW7_9BILA|nr:unnamed protein product [Rotaria socialis]CAF3205253.1 unnamed protein product [Rotaria socialis]CAF3332501.1 unnamed protein product [Rotaria socialis]CAF3364234.1 unnamed protein product [Rotaria socialis]CAF3432242.1 unnamed protein product [Rotaria socialis]